jgi:hypothetical protein
VGLKLKGTHQLLVYADDVNLLDGNIDTIKKNTETLIDVNKEVGLKVNAEKSKYILLTRYQHAGRNNDITTGNTCLENVTQFKYLGTTVTNQNSVQKKIKKRIISVSARYHSVQKLLSFRLLTKNVNI